MAADKVPVFDMAFTTKASATFSAKRTIRV